VAAGVARFDDSVCALVADDDHDVPREPRQFARLIGDFINAALNAS
jgi:hypothetical protein